MTNTPPLSPPRPETATEALKWYENRLLADYHFPKWKDKIRDVSFANEYQCDGDDWKKNQWALTLPKPEEYERVNDYLREVAADVQAEVERRVTQLTTGLPRYFEGFVIIDYGD